MKKLLFLALPAMLASCANSNEYKINGTASADAEGKHVYLVAESSDLVDSCLVTDGKFTFKGTIEGEELCLVSFGHSRAPIILQQGTEAEVDLASMPTMVKDNGGLNDTFYGVMQNIMNANLSIRDREDKMRDANASPAEIETAMQPARDSVYNLYRESITNNKDNMVGAYILSMTARSLFGSLEMLDSMKNEVKYVSKLKSFNSYYASLKAIAATQEGQPFTDFAGKDLEGNDVKLSDYVGKGKFVLIDFWASWCGPCKAEIPNLMELYKKFGGEKFTVVGINVYDEEAKCKETLKAEGVEYPQIIVANNTPEHAAKLYGVSGIPQIMLFAPDGTILKRNLRGEEMKKFVADQLK
jgi:thiol-disulfide isomerase/thioredoxin